MVKRSKELSTLVAGSGRRTGRDPLLAWMKANGEELSARRYLELAYPDGVPDPLPPDVELPPELTVGSTPTQQ